MAGIALHHDARLAGKAELRHYGVQIRRIDKGTGHQQHFAAVFQIGLQLRDLVHKAVGCKIRSGRIDDQQLAVLRDGACEQIQRLQVDILGFQRFGQRGSRGLLTVVGGVEGMAFCPGGQLVDGRTDLLFACKRHICRAGGVVIGVVVFVELSGVQHHAVLAADHDQAAGGYILCTVLGRKGRIEGGVFLFPVETAALIGIMIQQLAHNGVFAAGLAEVVDRHILIKALHQLSGAVAQSVHLGGRKIEFGVLGRDRTCQQVDQYRQHDRCRQNGRGIQPAAEHLAVCGGSELEFFHIIVLLSVPAAFFQSLRRKKQKQYDHGEVIHQCRNGKAVVDELFKGSEQT